jgi:hypothetical protein
MRKILEFCCCGRLADGQDLGELAEEKNGESGKFILHKIQNCIHNFALG